MQTQFAHTDGGLRGPGLIDIHTHGYGGVDALQGKGASLVMAQGLVRHGIVGFLPTLATAVFPAMSAALADIAACMARQREKPVGARILGAHIEGVFFCDAYRGAHRAELLRPPTVEAFRELAGEHEGIVKRVSLAPEMEGARELTRYLVSRGIQVSLAHTNATFDQSRAVVDAGASSATHLFNGMRALHHREPGVLGFSLTDDRVTGELIADGVHTHPAILALAARAKGAGGVCLVSDAMAAAGLGDGTYALGAEEVIVKEGVARIAAGNLAGSTLTLDEAVRRMSAMGGVPIGDAALMASDIPARLIGYGGASEIGECLWTRDFHAIKVWVGGTLAHQG